MTQAADDDPTLAGSEPIVVRVKKYAICDFRAFPGPELYEFEVNGRNLLVWGENGSGKSSFYKALQALLDPQNDIPFAHFKNIFSSTPEPFEEGVVSIELDNATPSVFLWSYGEERPTDYSFRQIATRATFLDYRSLLRAQADDEDAFDLFPLLMNVLLRYVPNPATGRQTFYEDWQQVLNFQPSEYPNDDDMDEDEEWPAPEDQLADVAQIFRGQLEDYLSDLETKTNEFLCYFLGRGDSRSSDTTIRFEFPDPVTITQNSSAYDIDGFCVRLRHTYGGASISTPATFLNEARLSALSISLYLAAAKQGSTPATVTVADQVYALPRLLILDDVLIGLDLSHRLPLLSLLEEHFADWQIVLTTFDRVWFDMASHHTSQTKKWVRYELYSDLQARGQYVFDVPLLQPDGEIRKKHPNCNGSKQEYFLAKAREQMNKGNPHAAAMYARAAFETVLKNFCEKQRLAVTYSHDPAKLNTNHFLDPIKKYNKEKKAGFDQVIERVTSFRKSVLNPMSHSSSVTLARREIEDACEAVQLFMEVTQKHLSDKKRANSFDDAETD